jgi:PBSX family phage terminase large subunit
MIKARRIDKPSFVWKYPSPKQEQIFYWWTPTSPDRNKAYAAFEGSVRSVKTSSASYSFINWSNFTFDQEDFALCGKTIGTCLRNVVRPLRKMLSIEPSFQVVERRSNAEGHHLEITQEDTGHTNLYWVYGGKDESSQDLIQGKTLAGALLDEVLLMPMSFVNQVMSRTSVEGSKLWFTFNPENATHEFYVNILDPYVAAGKAFYLHLTMADNWAMSDEARDRISSQWPVGSVWYRRNVLGERANAEGAIYPFFTDRPQDGYVISELPDDFTRWRVAGDYGQDHPTALGLYGYSPKLTSWILVREYFETMKTNQELSNDFGEQMLKWDGKEIVPEFVDIDTGGGGLSLLNQLRQDYPNLKRQAIIRHAIKINVNAEIASFASALYTHKFRYYAQCKRSIKETSNYRWAKTPSGKEEPMKINDDGPDRDRYMWNRVVHNG